MDNNLVEKLAEQLYLKDKKDRHVPEYCVWIDLVPFCLGERDRWLRASTEIISNMETPDTRLAIVRKVGVLPKNPYTNTGRENTYFRYREAQQDMLNANYVQEVK